MVPSAISKYNKVFYSILYSMLFYLILFYSIWGIFFSINFYCS